MMSLSRPYRFDDESGSLNDCRRTATRADILDAVALTCPGLSRVQVRELFEMTLDEMASTLAKGEFVKLRSFGLFTVRKKRERIGRNPRTGVEVPIKPRRVLTFRPSPVLLGVVNGRPVDAPAPTSPVKRVWRAHGASPTS